MENALAGTVSAVIVPSTPLPLVDKVAIPEPSTGSTAGGGLVAVVSIDKVP